jgi:hypothetical protein
MNSIPVCTIYQDPVSKQQKEKVCNKPVELWHISEKKKNLACFSWSNFMLIKINYLKKSQIFPLNYLETTARKSMEYTGTYRHRQ